MDTCFILALRAIIQWRKYYISDMRVAYRYTDLGEEQNE